MLLAKSICDDENPYVLQIVLPTLLTQRAVNQSICSLSLLADQAYPAKIAQASWWDPIADERHKRRSSSLEPSLKKSPNRMAALTAECGDHTKDLKVEGWDWIHLGDQKRARRHFLCSGLGDSLSLADEMSYIVELVIRFENVVQEFHRGWRIFAKNAVHAVAARGGYRCGVIDILPTRKGYFGDAFIENRVPQSYLRAMLWSRWVAAATRGEDMVPWPGQAVVLSESAVHRAGGIVKLTKLLDESVVTIPSARSVPTSELIEDGGAIVWLAPHFEQSLPKRDPDTDLNIDWTTGPYAAALYSTLQRLGVAL